MLKKFPPLTNPQKKDLTAYGLKKILLIIMQMLAVYYFK